MTDVPENDSGVDDGELNPLTGETYDATLGEYRGEGEAPAQFTEAQFDEVREFFRGLVQRRDVYPMARLLEPDNRVIDRYLNSIAYHAPAQATQLQSTVRGMMRIDARDHGVFSDGGMSPYTNEIIREFNFKPYIDANDRLRRDVAQRRRARASRTRDRQRPVATGEGMSVDDMLASDSVYLTAVGVLLKYRRGRIWWDEFQKNYYTDWGGGHDDRVIEKKPLTEDVILSIKTWMIPYSRALSKLGTLTLTEAVQHVAKMDTRNELTEYLGGLQWDGTERLAQMAKMVFGIENDPYATRAIVNMMVSAVARAYDPGCQMSSMVVIQSPQDMGKSKLIRVLAGPRWYREVVARPNDKDFVVNMTGGWLLEVAELASIAKHGTDDPVVKDAISRASDFIRPPYGRTVQEYKRSSIFIGTTNDSHWHRDVTGGKRFWPVTAIRVDIEWAAQWRDQLWAEAVKAYRDGHAYWEVPREAHAEALNLVAQHDPLEDGVWTRLVNGARSGGLYLGRERLVQGVNEVATEGTDVSGASEEERFGNLVTTERVGVWWMGISVENINKRQHDVRRLLTRLGMQAVKRRAGSGPRWFWTLTEEGERRLAETGARNTGTANSDQWNLIPE